MRAKYAELNGLDELSEASGLSKYHFSRLFHRTKGVTPLHYLTNIRMEKAVELLRHSTLTVEEIAAGVGYASGNYFCKVFRSKTGSTPGQFRAGKGFAPVDFLLFK
ncbi:helix-turn-helix transcriptional regulator [Paenibacillus koleovorans]|uniref:helix-turn-helix transcriptional regulator n=1 Tax=Paenibacillus koleovorans TaxID=121608 RepID=UPI000FD7AF1A|nr:helix-turn-helix transcriptional regulator [Paenibacillus koleovorans]